MFGILEYLFILKSMRGYIHAKAPFAPFKGMQMHHMNFSTLLSVHVNNFIKLYIV